MGSSGGGEGPLRAERGGGVRRARCAAAGKGGGGQSGAGA
jgi:hypothetical protein